MIAARSPSTARAGLRLASTEVFDIADPKNAQTLLDELKSPPAAPAEDGVQFLTTSR